jgi:hypothetical protein
MTTTTLPPHAVCTITTDAGPVTTICERYGEHFAVTPETERATAGGAARMTGLWVVTHLPTGYRLCDGPGCIRCARRSAGALAEIVGVDWSAVPAEPSGIKLLIDGWPVLAQREFHRAVRLGSVCTVEECTR